MDFHSLTRKELQALCKKNKIPANITNVAMADALAALENVEGLEELLNQSPAMPRTVTRTATRRKPTKEEPETAQPTTRTRGRTRRAMDQDLDKENKKVNVVETPAKMPASRRRAPAAETTPAVQTGYSTRRSVRLLEKSLAELSLKEAVKMDVLLDETEETDVSGDLENTNDSSSGEVLLECERELKDEVQEKDDMVAHDSSHLGNVSGLDAKDDSSTESSDQLDKSVPVDALVAERKSESENPFAYVCDEISAEDRKEVDESGDDDCVLVSESPSETKNASDVVMETENVPDEGLAAEVHLKEEDLELPFDSDSWETDSNHSVNESNAGNVFSSDANVDNNDSDFQKSVIGKGAEEVGKESFVFDNVQASNGFENSLVEMEESSASEGLVDVNLIQGKTPKFAKQTNPSCELISEDVENKKDMIDDVYVMPSQEYDFAANLPPLPDTPPSGEKMSPCLSKIPQVSPLGANDTIATQFPRPTQSTTPVKSPSKKQTTDQKLTLLLADNKENIDNSGMKVEPKKDKVKPKKDKENIDNIGMKVEPKKDKVKKKNIIDVDSLNEKSLRELTKMFKQKVQIHNKKKNIDEEQFPAKQAQVGKARPALQTLAENVMLPEK